MNDTTPAGEEAFIAEYLAPLAEGFSGAFGLRDDCAELLPLPGHALVMKTDPVVEGVHFFADDPPADIAWKALAVNVSDLAAKGARPLAYLMALTLPRRPERQWMRQFTSGLSAAQEAFGCCLIGGDTDCCDGPLSIAITVIGEVRAGRMVPRAGARAGDAVYVSGELGGAALGLALRVQPDFASAWPLASVDREAALARYLRSDPKVGLRGALQAYARSAMDISDGLVKDLDRMCRLTGVGADIELAALPLASGLQRACTIDRNAALRLITSGDDYEVLATVPPALGAQFERAADRGGSPVTRIGRVTGPSGVRLLDDAGQPIELERTGWDHFVR